MFVELTRLTDYADDQLIVMTEDDEMAIEVVSNEDCVVLRRSQVEELVTKLSEWLEVTE